MGPDAFIVHRIPGRLRIRVPSRKGDTRYFASLRDVLSAAEGVDDVEAAPLTGSVLVRHSAPFESIIETGQSQGLFVVKDEREVKVTVLHDSVSTMFGSISNSIKGASGKGFDLAGLAFLGLVGAGIYQIGRGNVAAIPWYTAFWYALGIFGKSVSKSDKEKGGAE